MTLEPQSQSRTHRISACYRHPADPLTGFCSSCLRERLAVLDPSGQLEPESSATNITFVSSLSSIGDCGNSMTSRRSKATVPSSLLSPELRRSKSVSASKYEASSGLTEPRRKSCDVRAQNTLSYLFNLDDKNSGLNRELNVQSKNLGFSKIVGPVFESREENDNGEEIRVSEDVLVPNVDVDGEIDEDLKTMKEHIDLEWQSRKHTVRDLKDIAGNFWMAASVFSKKFGKWRQKQKVKKRICRNGKGNVGSSSGGSDLWAMRVDKRIGEQLRRETQSEMGDYGFGRRSCDTEPRFSVDAGRMSVDDSRFSFDEPRASWDGYLIARTIPRLTPMLSVVENAMLAPVNRSDNHGIPIEEQMRSMNEDEMTSTSGGSAKTRDGYSYSDTSSSQRRNSFDRSKSIRRSSSKKTLGLEVDEVKSVTNAKVSPAKVGIFHGTKLVITERELKDWHLNSLKDDSENLESVSKDETFVAIGGTPKGFKKSSRWSKVFNVWGFRHRDTKFKDFAGNLIDPPVDEASEKQCREVDGVEEGASNGKLIRSSSCVSSRNSCKMMGSYHRTRGVVDTRGGAKKGREEFVLERNRSARSKFDNGLSRFYLTPFRSYGRSKSGKSSL